MIMADVLTWFLIIAGLYLVFVCYWLGAFALFSGTVERCREGYDRPVRATLVGLGILAPMLILGIAGVKAGVPGVPGAFLKGLLLLLALPALLGSAGLALRIGSGLPSALDVNEPWRRVLRGGLVLAPMFLLPFLGWFIVLPWALVSGFGVAVLARHPRSAASAARSTPSPTAGSPEAA